MSNMLKPAVGGQFALTASLVKISTLLGIKDDIRIDGEITFPSTHTHAITLQLSDASNPIVIAAATGYSSPRRVFSAGSVSVYVAPADGVPDATDVVLVDCSVV